MDPIVHFEIPANNPARAKKFYENIFGWKINFDKNYDYYMIDARQGFNSINGGMMKRKDPKQPFMNYIHVKSIDATMKKVLASGGKPAMPKMSIGDMGWIAAFVDPEGNCIGLHEVNAAHAKKMMAMKIAEMKKEYDKEIKSAKTPTAKPSKPAAKKKKQ